MRSEIISHFFLVPQNVPLAISRSMSGWRDVEDQVEGCWAMYWSKARITAELPTVQPKASDASWLSRWRRWSASWLSVKVWGKSGCFLGVGFVCAIREIISHVSIGRYEENKL